MMKIKLNYDKLTRGWFSARKAVSYNRHLMAITGKRSTGKSTGVAIFLICEYYRTGQGWIYVRRTKDTTDLTCKDWFDNACDIINAEYNIGVKVTCKGGFYYISDKSDIIVDDSEEEILIEPQREEHVAGRVIPLSLQQKFKGSNLSMFDWIVYDEFIAFAGESYLGTSNDIIREYKALMSLYETADRGIGIAHRNAVKIFCLGNNDSYYNPVYIALGADKYLRTDTKILSPKGEEWLVQQLAPEDAPNAEEYKDSVGYKLADARTRAYAYENKADQDNNFIENVEGSLKALFCLVFDGFKMTVYQYKDGLFVAPGQHTMSQTIALTKADHTPDYRLATGFNGYEIRQLRKLYEDGHVRFKDQKCKYCIDNYFKFV